MSEPIMHGSSDDWNKMNPQFRTRLLSELTRLKAENARLRKAGDDLSASLTICSSHPNCGARDEWLRAKKGLPSLAEQWEREKNNNDRAAKEGKPSA